MINRFVSTDEFYTEYLRNLLQLKDGRIKRFNLHFRSPDVPVIVTVERYVRGLKGKLLVVDNDVVTIKRNYYLRKDFGKYKLVPMESPNASKDDAVRKVEEDSGGSEESGDVADSKA